MGQLGLPGCAGQRCPSSSTLVRPCLGTPVQQAGMGCRCWMGWGVYFQSPCFNLNEMYSIHTFSTTEDLGHLHLPHLCCANLQYCSDQPAQDSQTCENASPTADILMANICCWSHHDEPHCVQSENQVGPGAPGSCKKPNVTPQAWQELGWSWGCAMMARVGGQSLTGVVRSQSSEREQKLCSH